MNVSTTSTHTHANRPMTHEGRKAGSMTSVMRSMPQASGPKVLRIGFVQGGRVLEDRILKDRSTVTVGASEAATFVVTSPVVGALAAPFKLFERTGNDYTLNLRGGMSGRVALATGIVELANVREPRLRLTEEARGKVVLGDTTFLFQFVAPPIPQSRPQLPLAIKGGLASQIDWNLTIIAAFSFLVHFGVVGSMYSDWMDHVMNTEATAGGLVELASRLPVAPLEIPESAPTTAATPTTTPTPAATTPTTTPVRIVDHPGTPERPSTAADIAALSNAAAAIEMTTMTVLNSQSSAVHSALATSEIPPVDLGEPAASMAGVRQATGNNLNFGRGGEALHPGTSTDLSKLALTRVDPNSGRAGHETDKGGPSGVVNVAPPITPTGSGEDIGAPRVVAGLRTGFRSCYNAGLNLDPTMSGRVTLIAKVGPNGEVASTDSAENVGLSSGVVQCLLKKLGTAQFDPGHGATSVRIPAGFIQQGK